jgi:hypothetical protein
MEQKYVYAIALIVVLGIVVLGVYWALYLQPTPLKDIVDTATEDGSFTTLVTALEAADLVDALKGEGPFTVFAPSVGERDGLV